MIRKGKDSCTTFICVKIELTLYLCTQVQIALKAARLKNLVFVLKVSEVKSYKDTS